MRPPLFFAFILGLASVVLALFLVSCSPAAGPGEIRVIDDWSTGVKSNLYSVNPEGKVTFFDETNERGIFSGSYECKQGFRMKAEPFDKIYQNSSVTKCTLPNLILKVTSKVVLNNLQDSAQRAIAKADFGTAALIYNDLAARLSGSNEEWAKELERKAYFYTAQSLGEEKASVFDTQQGKHVMSPELQSAVKVFQRKNGLMATGALDWATLNSLSGKKAAITDFARTPFKY